MSTSTQTMAVLHTREVHKSSPNQTNRSLFTGFSREIGRLLVKREKTLQSDIKLVDLHCSKCSMSLQGQYPRYEALPLEKEFKRQHAHDIIEEKKGVRKWILQILHLSG